MILCPDCAVDVFILGARCLELLSDCIEMYNEDLVMAIDPSHLFWKLHRNGTLKPCKDLEEALELLEKQGYVISTEISERLLGVCLNIGNGEYDEQSNIVCWCS